MYGDYCLLERHMFGEMEITFPMKVRTLAIEKTEQFSKESLMFNH
jgi:hypothetical protein